MTTPVDLYGPLDWSLIIAAILKQAKLQKIEISLEQLNEVIAGDDIVMFEEDPVAHCLRIALITRQEAEALQRFRKAEVYGSLKKPSNH